MSRLRKRKILGASIGHCVHVGGILSFLRLAEDLGYESIFLGPAVSLRKLALSIQEHDPDLIALSYRLTPEVLEKLLDELRENIHKLGWREKSFVFGGIPPAAKKARQSGLFEAVFSGIEPLSEIQSFLKGDIQKKAHAEIPPQSLIDRVADKHPYPLLRHHFGLPTVEETVKGAKTIALSGTIDVISLGPDQNAQESFFRPLEMKKDQDGAGGVPLRKPEHLTAIYEATRCGNHPLLRCYSGTRDLVPWAEMSLQTINIAWGAVPLFWYSTLDGRSGRTPAQAIRENQAAMRWYAEHDLPLEVNESHHWSLREAPDAVAVAAAFLAAYNAKKCGVRRYVAQYMFNTPANTSSPMDLAKMLAKIEIIESLHDEGFTSLRQTRTGLASLSFDPHVAKGQLSASCLVQLALDPKIIHVVGFCEGDHAATPEDVMESAKIVEGVIRNHALGPLALTGDPRIKERQQELVGESRTLLEAIRDIAAPKTADPWTDPTTLSRAVKKGILDAPQLAGNSDAAGKVCTRIIDGACVAVDPKAGKRLSEKLRIAHL